MKLFDELEKTQQLWLKAERGEFNGLPVQLEPRAFFLPVVFTPWQYSAKRAYECWLKTGNPELGGR